MRNLIKKGVNDHFAWILFIFMESAFLFQSCTNESYSEKDSSIDRTIQLNNFKKSMQIAEKNSKSKEVANKSIDNEPSGNQLAEEFVQQISSDALILIKSYGVTEQDLINQFGSLDRNKIALTAQLIVAEEELINQGKTLSIFIQGDYQFSPFLSNKKSTLTVTNDNTVGSCVLEAIGIRAVVQVLVGDIAALGTAGVLKIIGNVASKYAGVIGAAVMVYHFSDCMGWLTQVEGPLPDKVSTSDDLVMVDRASKYAFKTIYYISKKAIKYKSANDFVINRNQSYRTFDVEYGDINNPIYKVTFGSQTVLGVELDPLTVREIQKLDVITMD